jgi:hypothetical protein
MTTIGNQHGVTAAINRLRTLDPAGTALKRNADGTWPSITTLSGTPQSSWKAYDKLERTLQILVADHDARQEQGGGGQSTSIPFAEGF